MAGWRDKVFGTLMTEWFEGVKKPSVVASTFIRYRIDFDLRIVDSVLWPKRLVEIKPPLVQAYYCDIADEHGVSAVKQTHKLLRQFFNYCVDNDWIIKSPLKTVIIPKDSRLVKEKKAFTEQEVEKLIEAAKSNSDYFIYVFLAFTGLRLGEAYVKQKLKIS